MTAYATPAYATPAQLLERTNVLRLAQLAVPTAGLMPAVDMVRAALLEQSTAAADDETRVVLAEAVKVVNTALTDGADLMRSYGLPAPTAPVPPVLVRLNCTLAMHYLLTQASALSDADGAAYKATLRLLEQHASGQVALVPPSTTTATAGGTAALSSDTVSLSSNAARYGSAAADGGDW